MATRDTTADNMIAYEKPEAANVIRDAVGALLPKYRASGCDAPDNVMDSFPNPEQIIEAQRILIEAMLPGKMSHGSIRSEDLGIFLMRLLSQSWRMLIYEVERALPFAWKGECGRVEGCHRIEDLTGRAHCILTAYFARLPAVRDMVIEDTRAAYIGDPAALSFAEVQLAYPGLMAIVSHRLAHELYRLQVPIIPRVMSEWVHTQTGIDIHPGASIGHGFFIDHGTGVVIGETTEIGNNVKVYQGVTLGAKSFALDENGHPIKHIKRHPTVEDGVVIYSNASILGGDVVIGRGSTIGGNVFLMESVPPNSFVAANHPDLQIKQNGRTDGSGVDAEGCLAD
jgi:serine O-acetyltransferase